MKHIVVTGCSRGIGQAVVEVLLARDDYHIIGTSTSGNSTFDGQTRFTGYALQLDDAESIAQFVSSLSEQNMAIDGLVNNAAVLLDEDDAVVVDRDALQRTFAVNAFGTVELTEKLLPYMRAKSQIINLSSNWGTFSDPAFSEAYPHYKMSKAALNMYTKLLAKRLSAEAIRVSALDPGWVQTDMGGMNAARKPADVAQEVVKLFEDEGPSGCLWKSGKTREW